MIHGVGIPFILICSELIVLPSLPDVRAEGRAGHRQASQTQLYHDYDIIIILSLSLSLLSSLSLSSSLLSLLSLVPYHYHYIIIIIIIINIISITTIIIICIIIIIIIIIICGLAGGGPSHGEGGNDVVDNLRVSIIA